MAEPASARRLLMRSTMSGAGTMAIPSGPELQVLKRQGASAPAGSQRLKLNAQALKRQDL